MKTPFKDIRQHCRIEQSEIAYRVGVSRSYISQIESGSTYYKPNYTEHIVAALETLIDERIELLTDCRNRCKEYKKWMFCREEECDTYEPISYTSKLHGRRQTTR